MARHTAKSHKIRKVEILVIQIIIFLQIQWYFVFVASAIMEDEIDDRFDCCEVKE